MAVAAVTGGIGVGVVAILVDGCAVSRPAAPSTNFVINIPVANDNKTIREVVAGRSSFLEIDEQTGGMALHLTVPENPDEVLGTAKVGDNLATPATEQELPPTPIGTIKLPGAPLPPVEIALEDLGLPTSIDAGGGVEIQIDLEPGAEIPEALPTAVDVSLPPVGFDLENIDEVVIQRGGIDISVTNGLPIPLSRLQVTLRDSGRGRDVGESITIQDVSGNGGTDSGRLSLDGESISGSLAFKVSIITGDDGAVTIGDDPRLVIVASLDPLEVSSVSGKIPQQAFAPEEPQIVNFPESDVKVDSAAISQGEIEITIDNQIPLIVNVKLSVLNLVDRDTGQPVDFEIPLDPRSTSQPVTFPLGNASFVQPRGRNPDDPDQLRVAYVATTSESDQVETISSDQALAVNVVVSPLVFSRLEGRLDQVSLDIPEQRQTVEIPAGLDNINIATTSLEVHVTSAIGFQAEVELDITGTNTAGEPAPLLPIRETFKRGDPDFPVSDTLTVSPVALTDFLNFLPSEIVINARVVVGDGVTPGIIDSSHSVTLDRVVFDTEPRLSITADTQMDPEESIKDITFRDSEARRKIRSNFVSGSVTATLENSIPLGVGVRLFVGRTRAAVFDTTSGDHVITIPRRIARFSGEDAADYPEPPFQAKAAPVDPETGFSDGIETTEITIELTADEVVALILEDDDPAREDDDHAKLFSGVRVTLPQTQGEVEIRADNFINIIAGMGVELLLNSDLLD